MMMRMMMMMCSWLATLSSISIPSKIQLPISSTQERKEARKQEILPPNLASYPHLQSPHTNYQTQMWVRFLGVAPPLFVFLVLFADYTICEED